jgi:hypothetical protein
MYGRADLDRLHRLAYCCCGLMLRNIWFTDHEAAPRCLTTPETSWMC